MTSGTRHWWLKRLSAVLLILLSYWLFAFLALCLHANYFETTHWLKNPVNLIGLLAWLLVACYHATIGVQVIIEDYVSDQGKQTIFIWIVHTFFAGLALSAMVLLLST